MRILSINLDDNNGLTNIKMKRLDKVVLLAGKNGSGKSRLLNEIKLNLSSKITKTRLENAQNIKEKNHNEILRYKDLIMKEEDNLKSQQYELKLHLGNIKQQEIAEKKLKGINSNLKIYKEEIERKENTIKTNDLIINTHQNKIETNNLYEKYEIIDFVPKTLNLHNPENKTKANIKQIVLLQDKGINASEQKTLVIIQEITDKWFRATHNKIKTSEGFNSKAIENYERLKDYLKLFLDTDLDFDEEEGIATIFGFKLSQCNLSDGQKVLLQLCIAIYEQENDLEKTIIFMDEPENHLHPKALNDVINKLSNIIAEGQIWIATHSINLLSNFEPKNIWYMEEGKIQHAGKTPEKVLEGLLGKEENILKLENFISLPSQMATNNFAYESLLSPIQVETGVDDPQVGQIIEAIKTKYNDSGKVKVLDFGAGKGRLLSTIDEIGQMANIPTIDWLDYYAYDLPSDNKQKCLNILNNIYQEDKERYFDDKSKFRGNIQVKTFDMIILSNVFHEIDPKYWNEEFREENSVINHALKDDGILLIIEDQLIPVGEKAYQNGFLVFDKEQFKILFNIHDYTVKEEREGRLKAHYIEKKYLVNMTHETKKDAIKSLKNTARENISKIRNTAPSYENGKLHAFWTQQLANSYLAYSEL